MSRPPRSPHLVRCFFFRPPPHRFFFCSLGVGAGMKPPPAALPSPGMSASVTSVQSQTDGDDTDTAAALITDDTAKSDDPTAPAAQSARDDASCTHALNDAVVVVAGKGRQGHEGIVRFVGATRFAPRVWGWRVAL